MKKVNVSKKAVCMILALIMCLSFAACGETKCNHEYEASVDGNTVTLKCKLCGELASADVTLPVVEVEKEVIKEVEKPIEKIEYKTVVKTVEKEVEVEVEKEVIKEVEVPVYLNPEDRISVYELNLLSYYYSNYEKLDFLRDYISQNFYKEVDTDALMEGAYAGMVEALGDKYSHYAAPSKSEEYTNALSQAYSGIGIYIYQAENGDAVVDSTTKNSPAEKAGLLPGDIIYSVNGEVVRGQGVDVAAGKIRGEVGTYAEVCVIRGSETLSFKVVRQQIALSTVDFGSFESGEGYISISGFNDATYDDVKEALDVLEQTGHTKLILDLRGNGGGNVETALKVADLFMDEGVMSYIEDRNGERSYYKTTEGRTPLKLVVLCDGNTASAAEMMCAGIQDNEEGTIVGAKTYGKGVVQVYVTFVDGSSLNLTEYQYFSPNGNAINEQGINPDYVISEKDADGNLDFDSCIEKAMEILSK